MAEQPRDKGALVQPGSLVFFPVIPGGSVVTNDGTLACDEQFLQVDYPVLFEIIGTDFNDAGKGDDDLIHMRTPPAPTWANDAGWEARVRF